ncbi:Hypothetical protein FSTVST1_425 [Faustovirus ST1]|nr:Hypothetical protein FSTVST1_425 [Faustovirus ST1]
MNKSMEIEVSAESANNIIPIWCEDIYYNIALMIHTARDLVNFASACKGFRCIAYVLIARSTPEVCIRLGFEDSTSYASKHYSVNQPYVVTSTTTTTNDVYEFFDEWCDKLKTTPMHQLQRSQQYKNIRSMYFANVFNNPIGVKLPFSRCECGLLTSNRLMLNVEKLDIVYNNNRGFLRGIYPGGSACSRRLILSCKHLCTKCMYKVSVNHQSTIALNNYAKATLASTLHLNGSKIFIHNLGFTTSIE